MTGVCDSEIIAVTVATGISVAVAVGRFEAVAITSGDEETFCEERQETIRRLNMRKEHFMYRYEKSGSLFFASSVKFLRVLS